MRNISMDPRYAAICGITEEELVTQIEAGVQAFATQAGLSAEAGLAVLKKNYDGYHFTAPSPDIYNPFSLLSALESGNPKAYWFETGTPTFLLELLKRYRWDMTTLQDCEAPEDSFDAAAEDLGTPLPTPLPPLPHDGSSLLAGVDAQLIIDVAQMPLGRVMRDEQRCLDLGGGLVLGEQGQDLLLAVGQTVMARHPRATPDKVLLPNKKYRILQ